MHFDISLLNIEYVCFRAIRFLVVMKQLGIKFRKIDCYELYFFLCHYSNSENEQKEHPLGGNNKN